jgi:hypothetical protein
MNLPRLRELAKAGKDGSIRPEELQELFAVLPESLEYLAKLETACIEIVALRDEAAEDPTTRINRSLQKLDTEIVQMSILLP